MKIATRGGADLTFTVCHIENDRAHSNSREVQEPILRHDRAYEVLAILLAPGQVEPHFWVLGEAYAERKNAGLVYPDLIAARDCRIVDAVVPADWVLRMWHRGVATDSILGPAVFTGDGFVEQLFDAEPVAVQRFLDRAVAIEPPGALS